MKKRIAGVLLFLFMTSCSQGELWETATEKIHNYIKVLDQYPQKDATNVSCLDTITVTFSSPILASSVSDTTFTFTGGTATGTFTLNAAGDTVSFTPATHLDPYTQYTITLTTAITSEAGETLESGYSWTFTTGNYIHQAVTLTETDTGTNLLANSTYAAVTLFLGESITYHFSIKNNGYSDLNISSINITGANASDCTLSAGTMPAVLSTGQSRAFSILFNPAATGTRTAALEIQSNDETYNPYIVNLTGECLPVPVVQLVSHVPSVNAVDIQPNSVISAVFDDNIDMTSVNATSFAVSDGGAVAGSYSYDATLKMITFTPSSLLSYSTTYTVALSTAIKTPTGAFLSAPNSWSFSTAAQPQPIISLYQTEYARDIVALETFNFGSTTAGGTALVYNYVIKNTGNKDLIVSAISITGTDAALFTAGGITFPATIPAGGSSAFTVSFSAPAGTAAGIKTAQLAITSDDPITPSFAFTMTGEITPTPVPDINMLNGTTVILTGGKINFGSTAPGTSLSVILTIENVGTGDLTIGTLSFDGTDAASFSVDTSSMTSTVAPGASTTVTVAFSPAIIGVYKARLIVPSDDPDETPYYVNLQGRAR